MISPGLLREMFDYHFWARNQQLAACAKLTSEQFTRALGGSFASLRDTLVHTAGADWIWCERWHGRTPRAFPKVDQFPGLPELQAYWQDAERDIRTFVGSVSEAELGRPLTYINLAGKQWTYPLWETLVHLINHGTYHYGQVTTLLRQLGAIPPAVDYLVMKDEQAAAASGGGRS